MSNSLEKIYADYFIDSERGEDMFVYTPEGSLFYFSKEDGYNDKHIPVTVTDPISRKNYLVVFDE